MKPLNLPTMFLAAAIGASPALADQNNNFEAFHYTTRLALEACEYYAPERPMPKGVSGAELGNIVGAIGYQSEGKNFSVEDAAGLCGAFKFFLDRYHDDFEEGQCTEPRTNNINYQICKSNDEIVLGPKGAWKDSVHDANRRHVSGKLRDLVEAVSLIEHGDELDDYKNPSVYQTIKEILETQNFERQLDEGDCTTFEVSARYDFTLKICEEGGELTVGKDAVRPVLVP